MPLAWHVPHGPVAVRASVQQDSKSRLGQNLSQGLLVLPCRVVVGDEEALEVVACLHGDARLVEAGKDNALERGVIAHNLCKQRLQLGVIHTLGLLVDCGHDEFGEVLHRPQQHAQPLGRSTHTRDIQARQVDVLLHHLCERCQATIPHHGTNGKLQVREARRR